jgi:mRNA interferase MazF
MRRGDVHVVTLARQAGHELAGRRYGVVVQSEAVGALSTVVIAPTSTSTAPTSFRPEIDLLGRRTAVITDHVRVIDRRRVGRRVDRLSSSDLRAVDDALKVVLGLL